MALEIVKNISVDFYDKKYQMINAKQYDDSSRWITITCYNQGDLFNLSPSKYSAYVKYRKADGYGVLSSCRINHKGEVLVELTEQMLAADGICYVDLVIINKGSAIVNIDTGEIITIDDSPILSTMAFCVNVYEASVDNSEFESSYEYDALNDLIQRAEADYTEVIQLAKSYAIGDANNIRENENFDNSKYYCEQAGISATNAKTSEENALVSEQNAGTSELNASISEQNALASEQNAKASEEKASVSEQNAATSEQNAKTSEGKALVSERNAKASETQAKHYYEQIENIHSGLDGSLSPKGTITFAELMALTDAEKFVGALYVISESFITDETFVEGEDIPYPAGTLVYFTVDGLWACFDGIRADVATVDEMKNYLGI